MEKIIRVSLLGVIVVLGFTAVFPQWLDFLVMERTKRVERQRNAERAREPSMPKDWHLTLSGTISEDTTYKVSVKYVAQKETRWCQDYYYQIWSGVSGLTQEAKYATYTPKVEDGFHSIKVPLREYSTSWGCQFKVDDVTLIVSKADGSYQNIETLFFNKNSIYRAKNETLNIECAAYSGTYSMVGPVGCKQKPFESKKDISQRLYFDNENWTVNIDYLDIGRYTELFDQKTRLILVERDMVSLCNVFHAYDYVNNENASVASVPVSDEVGQNILSGEYYEYPNLSSGPTAQVYVRRFEATLRNARGDVRRNQEPRFIDPWFRPYVYKRSEDGRGYEIVSNGPNESTHADDIKSSCQG